MFSIRNNKLISCRMRRDELASIAIAPSKLGTQIIVDAKYKLAIFYDRKQKIYLHRVVVNVNVELSVQPDCSKMGCWDVQPCSKSFLCQMSLFSHTMIM